MPEIQTYKNWKAVTEADFVSLFIKTWFAYISTLRIMFPEAYNRRGDKKYFLHPEQLQNESPILMAELHQLIHFAGKFCNNLLCYLNGGVVGYNSLQTEDLKDLLLKVSI